MQIEEEAVFEWKEVQGGVCITGCTASLRELSVPEQIAGLPVVQIGDYAFQGMDELEAAALPSGIRHLGDHAFFNCMQLRELAVYDGITYVGDGSFKNCDRLERITFHVRKRNVSALRRLIYDVMQDVYVDILYEDADPAFQTKLVFPAFYFDYIENYPARIFEEIIYGAGQAYRQCFRGGDVDYEAYDELFERSTREDSVQAILGHAAGRLSHPYRLSEGRKAVYRNWLSTHGTELLKESIKMDAPEQLELALGLDLYDEEQTRELLDRALAAKKVEYVNLLMAYQGRRFHSAESGRRKKRYLL